MSVIAGDGRMNKEDEEGLMLLISMMFICIRAIPLRVRSSLDFGIQIAVKKGFVIIT